MTSLEAPANPANWWVSGSKTAAFEYEPGKDVYYVLMRTDGSIRMPILIWANSEEHVRSILQDMVNFGLESMSRYTSINPDLVVLDNGRRNLLNQLENCLQGEPSKYTLTIEQFIPTHPVKVAWASNDTIL